MGRIMQLIPTAVDKITESQRTEPHVQYCPITMAFEEEEATGCSVRRTAWQGELVAT